MRDIVAEGLSLLEDAVRRCCGGGVGLVFSAGVDSTLIGFLASRHAGVEAYSVGVKGSHDLDYAREIMGQTPFRINCIELAEDDVEGELPKIINVIKSASPLDAGVGIPFHFASKRASSEGIKTMLCGQGSDELFGGYSRYIELLGSGSYDELDELMRKDLRELPESNLWRDRMLCEANGVKLEIPFLDKRFVDYVQEIPAQLKVKELSGFEEEAYECVDEINGMRFVRKYVLRKMAERAGLPEPVIQRVKKAAQYGSGSQKTLERLARKNGFKEKASNAGRRDYTQMYLESLLRG